MEFVLGSSAFSEGGEIPARYTCEGENISPALEWSHPPEGAKSFVLIVDDPDAPDPEAPKMVFVHWVVYDIPATVNEIGEGALPRERLSGGGTSGTSDFRRLGYGGPCPPIGRHHYFFKLYALDALLHLDPGKTKREILAAMEGHVLGEAVLSGTYKKG